MHVCTHTHTHYMYVSNSAVVQSDPSGMARRSHCDRGKPSMSEGPLCITMATVY